MSHDMDIETASDYSYSPPSDLDTDGDNSASSSDSSGSDVDEEDVLVVTPELPSEPSSRKRKPTQKQARVVSKSQKVSANEDKLVRRIVRKALEAAPRRYVQARDLTPAEKAVALKMASFAEYKQNGGGHVIIHQLDEPFSHAYSDDHFAPLQDVHKPVLVRFKVNGMKSWWITLLPPRGLFKRKRCLLDKCGARGLYGASHCAFHTQLRLVLADVVADQEAKAARHSIESKKKYDLAMERYNADVQEGSVRAKRPPVPRRYGYRLKFKADWVQTLSEDYFEEPGDISGDFDRDMARLHTATCLLPPPFCEKLRFACMLPGKRVSIEGVKHFCKEHHRIVKPGRHLHAAHERCVARKHAARIIHNPLMRDLASCDVCLMNVTLHHADVLPELRDIDPIAEVLARYMTPFLVERSSVLVGFQVGERVERPKRQPKDEVDLDLDLVEEQDE